jgi:error-prone DNA polymerase
MVISTRSLDEICPSVPTRTEGRRILQWDKDSCGDAGLLKIDLLGLGMLSAVDHTVAEVERLRGERIDLSRIPLEDEATWRSIREARTTGVFQIESRAQMQMLPRTRPRNLRDLTVQVALVRPGPIQGGAVHPYIERRKRLREDPDYEVPYEHPLLEAPLSRTLGTIVFQEQVLEVAVSLAGFSPAEAEGLRRAMSRRRSAQEIARHHELFRSRCAARGIPAEVAERTWARIEGFSGFGFPEAHSWSFGLLAYQSAWLCEHYAPEALAGLLNEQPMGFYPPDWLIHEAGRRGVDVLAANVNLSRVRCAVECGEGGLAVRLGLAYIRGVEEKEMEDLVARRGEGGFYRGVGDLASRSGASRDALERLAWAGALDGLPVEGSRRERAWEAGSAGTARGARERRQLVLPLEPSTAPGLAPLTPWQRMVEDYRSTGVTTGTHPMALLRPALPGGMATSRTLEGVADGATVEPAGMVVARQRPEAAGGITFLLLEDEWGPINLIVPSRIYESDRAVVRAAPLVRARGRLERREGVINVVVERIAALEWREPPRRRTGSAQPQADKGSRGLARLHRARRRAVAELQAVVPAGHAFGRRGG